VNQSQTEINEYAVMTVMILIVLTAAAAGKPP